MLWLQFNGQGIWVMTDPLQYIPDGVPLLCEDHPNRKATHTLAGIGLLCDECAALLRRRFGYPVLKINPSEVREDRNGKV